MGDSTRRAVLDPTFGAEPRYPDGRFVAPPKLPRQTPSIIMTPPSEQAATSHSGGVPDTLVRGKQCELEAIAALKALNFVEGEMFMIGVRNYALQARIDGEHLSLWHTNKPAEKGGDWTISSPIFGGWDYLVDLSKADDIFIFPNKCQNGMSDRHVTRFDVVFFEIDPPAGSDISAELRKNRAFIRELAERGFVLSAQIYSGNKSDHGHFRLTEDVGRVTGENLSRKAAIAFGGDPAVVTASRKMRFPNVFRTKNGVTRYCKSKVTDAVYTPSELEAWLDTLIKEKYGVLPPDYISADRFRAYKRLNLKGLPRDEVVELLIADEYDFQEKFTDDIDLSDVPTEILQPIALKALATIPESMPGDGSYSEIFRRICGGMKAIFGAEEAISHIEQHSPTRVVDQVVHSLDKFPPASLFKAAREYGGYEWGAEEASLLVDHFHDEIARVYSQNRGKALSIALAPLRKKVHLLGCPDHYWRTACNDVAAIANISPIYGADEDWWQLYSEQKVGLGGARGEGNFSDSPEWIRRNQIIPWVNLLKGKAKHLIQFDYAENQREIVSPDELPAHNGTGYVVSIFNEEQRFDVVTRAPELGYVVTIEDSGTGTGKTHGVLNFGGKRDRITLLLEQHREPHVPELAELFWEMPTRHDGMYRWADGKLRRSPETPGQKPEQPSICRETNKFLEAAAVGRNLEVDSPCFSCSAYEYCGRIDPELEEKDGYGFRYLRSEALRKGRLRAHISQMGGVPEALLQDRIAIVDEAMRQLKATITFTVTFAEIYDKLRFVDRVGNPAASDAYRPFIRHLEKVSAENTTPFAVGTEDILKNAPAPCSIDDKAYLKGILTSTIDGEMNWKYCEDIIYQEIAYSNTDARLANPSEPVSDLIKVWCGDQGSIQVYGDTVTVTMPDFRNIETLKKFQSVLLLDATPNISLLAKLFQCEESEILVIRRSMPDNSRLNITVVETPGARTRSSILESPQVQDRLNGIITEIQQKRDPNLRVIGMKGNEGKIIAQMGYFGRNSRGCNLNAGVRTLVTTGLPQPNLGTIRAEWFAMTGSYEGFEDYYNFLIAAEIIQVAGRQRAHRYDGDFELFMLCSGLDPSFLIHLGCKVNHIHAAQIHPRFGSKSQYKRWRLAHVAKQLLETHGKVTQQAIAEALGISQQAVQQVVSEMVGGWKTFRQKIQGCLIEPTKGALYFDHPDQEFEDWQGFTALDAIVTFATIIREGDWNNLDLLMEGATSGQMDWLMAIALNIFALNPDLDAGTPPPIE